MGDAFAHVPVRDRWRSCSSPAGFLFSAWRLWRGAAREHDGLAAVAAAVDGDRRARARRRAPRGPQGIGPLVALPPGRLPVPPTAWRAVAWDEPVRGPSALAWIVDRITPRPLRGTGRVRSRASRSGRLDRLDLLLVVVVFLSALTLRAYRLAEPYDMYFDEVYHARTAMEFLQDWRYGEPHDIYEWTHPHLAKYAMALGIEVFGDHRVTGQLRPGRARRRRPPSSAGGAPTTQPGARDGDRLYVATGTAVGVYDLADQDPDGHDPVRCDRPGGR